MESYTLFQVNEYIRRVIALNFREPLWIEAEIVQAKDSRGNYYIDLIEKEASSDKIIAQAGAVVWTRNFGFIRKKIGDLIFDLLRDGTQVRLKCRIDFNERYGFKLVIEDIDPNYTFGKMELKRQQIINQLEVEGLMELNKSLVLPEVVQRIAIISSASAAGYQDFVQQLTHNPYGFAYKIDLYNTAVQGTSIEQDTVAAITEISQRSSYYHAAIIIRGGGSKLDLSGYDNYAIAKSIACCEVPFIIGIGHDIDTTIVDLVSCLSLKTPTAVADFLIDRSARFESRCAQLSQTVHQLASHQLYNEALMLRSIEDLLIRASKDSLRTAHLHLEHSNQMLAELSKSLISEEHHRLEKFVLQLDARDPQRILAQGYSVLRKDGKTITSATQVVSHDLVSITFEDGIVEATIL